MDSHVPRDSFTDETRAELLRRERYGVPAWIAEPVLSRYFRLMERLRPRVREVLDAAEIVAIVATLWGTISYDHDLAPSQILIWEVQDAVRYEALLEHHDVDIQRLITKLDALDPALMVALLDGVEIIKNAEDHIDLYSLVDAVFPVTRRPEGQKGE